MELVEKLILERATEIGQEVDSGANDPEELAALLVQESLEEEEVITCPILKAFRRFDEEMTNATSEANFAGMFQAMGDDELEVGTHKFYAEIAPEEVEYLSGSLSSLGVSSGGQFTYDKYKRFIEDTVVPTEVGKGPTNMITALLAKRLDRWRDKGNVVEIWSPRTCRARLAGEDPEKFTGEKSGSKSPKEKRSPKGSDTQENAPGSPRTKPKRKSEEIPDDKKDKKEKKKNSTKEEEAEEEGTKDKK